MSSEINIEAIMKEIRQEIADKHLTNEMLSFEDVPYDAPGDKVTGYGLDSEEARKALVYVNGHYSVQPYKPLGGNALAVFVKKVIRRLTKFYVEPVVFDQNEFNANADRLFNAVEETAKQHDATAASELAHRIEVLELNQKHLATKIEALEEENASLRAKLLDKGL